MDEVISCCAGLLGLCGIVTIVGGILQDTDLLWMIYGSILGLFGVNMLQVGMLQDLIDAKK